MGKLPSTLLFIRCLLVAAGPLNFMQMIAWGNMIHDYSQDSSLAEAANMTFSGEYPCEMCRRIAQAKAEVTQDNHPSPAPLEERTNLRLDFNFPESIFAPNSRWKDSRFLTPGELAFIPPLDRFQQVPTPPPKLRSC